MAQVIDEIGQGFQALEQLLGSLDLAFQQLTEQFQASQTQLSNRTQSWSHGLSQVGQASCELQSQLQQIDGQLSTADQHWQALATSLHDWESQRELKLSQQAEPLQSKSQSLITQIESLHQECRARVQQLQPASQNLHQFESSSHSQFESDLQLAQLRLQKWQHLLEQSLDPLRASLSTTQELLAGMRKGLEQDARRTVPESLAPLQQWLKASLPQSLSDFRQQTLELVLQSFTQYQEGALARAAQFSNAAGGLYGGLIQLELQSLPSSVAEAFQQQAKPGVQKVSPEVSRARRSTQSADNIAREVEVFQGVIQFAFEYFAQQAAASGAVAPAPVGARIQPQKEDDSLAPPPVIEAFEWGATQQEENLSPNAPLFRPARGEEHLWVQRGDGSWVKSPPRRTKWSPNTDFKTSTPTRLTSKSTDRPPNGSRGPTALGPASPRSARDSPNKKSAYRKPAWRLLRKSAHPTCPKFIWKLDLRRPPKLWPRPKKQLALKPASSLRSPAFRNRPRPGLSNGKKATPRPTARLPSL